MTLSPISSSSLTAAYSSPAPVQQQQPKAPLKTQLSDVVTLSKQALQMATDGEPKSQEVRESGAQRSSETAQGKA
jgi:type II secretory pathway component PulM